MAKELDSRVWPKQAPAELSEFILLMMSMQNFYGALSREKPPGSIPVSESAVNFFVEMWLGSGFATEHHGLETDGFAMATLIRNTYQPAMLRRLPDALKPMGIELTQKMDMWLMDGMRIWLCGHGAKIDIVFPWFLRQGEITRHLKRLRAAIEGPHEEGSLRRVDNLPLPATSASKKGSNPVVDPVAIAVTMKVNDPKLSVRKAAAAVGISSSKLQRNPLWKVVVDRLKQVGTGRIGDKDDDRRML